MDLSVDYYIHTESALLDALSLICLFNSDHPLIKKFKNSLLVSSPASASSSASAP